MNQRVNLIEDFGNEEARVARETLEAVRLSASEVAVIPFTAEMSPAELHYCDEPGIRGYVHCNGKDHGCVLCQIGKGVEQRALLPVYQPLAKAVAVLPISPSARPGALLPQVKPVLRSGKQVILFINKPDRAKFVVSTVELKPGMDDGAAVIAAFQERWEAGEVDLGSVFPHYENRDLAAIPAVAEILTLKGIDPNDVG